MARSTYIYLIRHKPQMSSSPGSPLVVGAFTVKHEAKAAIDHKSGFDLWRYRDGAMSTGEIIPWDEEIGPQRAAPQSMSAIQAEGRQLRENCSPLEGINPLDLL